MLETSPVFEKIKKLLDENKNIISQNSFIDK